MADTAYRGFQQHGNAAYYHQQHNQQFHHGGRHLPRSGSPVNGSRGNFVNDTPSPSRSPVSQASSNNHYGLYNQGHQQAPHVLMNGNHQRYMPQGAGHKYQHQSYQQQNQSHHHQQNNLSNHGVNHQHTFSSGTMSNVTPSFTPSTLHNGGSNSGQIALNEGYVPSQHWQHQIQLSSMSRQAQGSAHHHSRKEPAVPKRPKISDQSTSEEDPEEGVEERNRAVAVTEESRQDWHVLDMSGQGFKALSPSLLSYEFFLTKLYLDHNKLRQIHPFICRLRKLTHLDVSNNGIAIIPPEIGMLNSLREFSVIDNRLTTLPPEIGHLFKLDMLAIDGNPLDDDIRDRIMHLGTKAVITYFREEYPQDFGPPIAPNPRPQIVNDSVLIDESSERVSVVSYNILCEKYATKSQYGYTSAADLDWNFRKGLILRELKDYDPDIACLQEVDRENYDQFFTKHLKAPDYRGVFWPKSRAKTMAEKDARLVDGCATFYRSSKFILLDKLFIDFANNAINRPDMKGEHDTFNRVMPRDNIAVVAFLENRATGSRLIVVNVHIHWDPAFADVKLIQVAIMMEQITKQAEKWAKHPPCKDKSSMSHSEADGEFDGESANGLPTEPSAPSSEYSRGSDIPLIICGDFNSAAGTGVYDLITKGSVPGDHADLGNRGYGNFTREGMAHPFKLQSAYTSPDQLAFTNYTPTFNGVIDYIWYSVNSLEVVGLLGDVDPSYLSRCPGFPNHFFPSDHLALRAEFNVK